MAMGMKRTRSESTEVGRTDLIRRGSQATGKAWAEPESVASKPQVGGLGPPVCRDLPGCSGSSCTGPESCPHPYSDLHSAPLTSLCATPEAGRDRLQREARSRLPHPTDELGPKGLGEKGSGGVATAPDLSWTL